MEFKTIKNKKTGEYATFEIEHYGCINAYTGQIPTLLPETFNFEGYKDYINKFYPNHTWNFNLDDYELVNVKIVEV